MEKKIFVLALSIPFSMAVSIAQNEIPASKKAATKPSQHINVEKAATPKPVIDAFNKLFPAGTKAKFDREKNGEYEANFMMNGIDMSANFTIDGVWRETETTIAVSQLPEIVVKSIKMNHPQAKIVGAAKIEAPDSGLKYEADLLIGKKKSEVLLDAAGVFIK